MTYYDPSTIKRIIEDHKADVIYAVVGMQEDWSWTAETVFEDGMYTVDLSGERVLLAGIEGSSWATPVIHLHLKDGNTLIFPAFVS